MFICCVCHMFSQRERRPGTLHRPHHFQLRFFVFVDYVWIYIETRIYRRLGACTHSRMFSYTQWKWILIISFVHCLRVSRCDYVLHADAVRVFFAEPDAHGQLFEINDWKSDDFNSRARNLWRRPVYLSDSFLIWYRIQSSRFAGQLLCPLMV